MGVVLRKVIIRSHVSEKGPTRRSMFCNHGKYLNVWLTDDNLKFLWSLPIARDDWRCPSTVHSPFRQDPRRRRWYCRTHSSASKAPLLKQFQLPVRPPLRLHRFPPLSMVAPINHSFGLIHSFPIYSFTFITNYTQVSQTLSSSSASALTFTWVAARLWQTSRCIPCLHHPTNYFSCFYHFISRKRRLYWPWCTSTPYRDFQG